MNAVVTSRPQVIRPSRRDEIKLSMKDDLLMEMLPIIDYRSPVPEDAKTSPDKKQQPKVVLVETQKSSSRNAMTSRRSSWHGVQCDSPARERRRHSNTVDVDELAEQKRRMSLVDVDELADKKMRMSLVLEEISLRKFDEELADKKMRMSLVLEEISLRKFDEEESKQAESGGSVIPTILGLIIVVIAVALDMTGKI